MIPVFKAKNMNGLLMFGNVTDTDRLKNYLKSLPDLVEVVIRRPRKIRSNKQNRYYRGVVIPLLAKSLGYSDSHMHEILKSIFLSEEFDFNGRIITIIRSTTGLKTDEFERYLSQIRTWASTDESIPKIYIPLPNEVEF